ncbi:MAG: threonine synthase [Ruminococcaceae bacterium]|nr:threonine synthase [Oscillospiraceae bacterium]
MLYSSTRDNSLKIKSAQAIKTGLSKDGGLFVPEMLPKITQGDLESLAPMSYNDRAVFILSKFLTDFDLFEVKECVDLAYSKEKFETAGIAPVYKLNERVYFLELWHGPTCAFKDMALQILPHLLTKSIQKCGSDKECVILVATSGDTGKAALEGFKDVDKTRIFVFYPERGVSEIQKLQMITQEGNNVGVAAVIGNFDDAQTGVKKIFTDEDYNERLALNGFELSSANSINWGRLVPQIVYYFSAYADLIKSDEIKLGDKINFAVPTGNFGNILAGYYAKKMGLPVNKFICASNENNVLTEFINTGVYDKNRKFHTTISPSMDILVSSNLERLLYDMTDGNDEKIREYMGALAEDGKYSVSADVLAKIQESFYAGCCNDEETMQTISSVNEEYSYVMDTHTAVGKYVYDKYAQQTGDTTKTVIASTASPFKFNQSVLIALEGLSSVAGKNEFELLDILAEKSNMRIPKSLSELKSKARLFDMSCEKKQMKQVVSEFLKVE